MLGERGGKNLPVQANISKNKLHEAAYLGF